MPGRKGQTWLFTSQLKSKATHTKQFYSFAGWVHRLDSFEEVLFGFQEPAYPGRSSWDPSAECWSLFSVGKAIEMRYCEQKDVQEDDVTVPRVL